MKLADALNKFVRDLANDALAIPNYAIKSKQHGAPRPSGAFCEVDFVSDRQIGSAQLNIENDTSTTVEIESETLRELMISINFHRDDAYDNARKLAMAFNRESVKASFVAAKLGFVRTSIIRQIDQTLEDGWQGRAQFDLFLSSVSSDTDIISCIESLDIELNVDTANNRYTTNIEVTS